MKTKRTRFLFWKFDQNLHDELDINPILLACKNLSETKTGALIIVANKSGLEQYVETGEIIDSTISSGLIENIFFKNSPLHDGAMIINNNKIKAARCILPVSNSTKIAASLGLRHRAAVGITEQSDAHAIIVSEETGKISVAKDGELKAKVELSQLKKLLLEELG